ncbi:unnamed protein product [Acanthoscelides obtectus]|uniref:Secreted protein n=1 Tax=Acanthoscelides obtectus TaxID=200917 RepID=A0A9P0LVD8_ACAOB|nr:unnamed protein product [Acanthoscelides obtectus]CAK1670951.1 Thrombospondin-2 [Acanthoscelides obtectus]
MNMVHLSVIPLAVWWSLLGVASAVNPFENEIDSEQHDTHHPNPKAPASELFAEVDILKLINVTAKDPGVSLIEGPISKFPAYKFRLPYGNVPLPSSSVVTSVMNNTNGFTVVFIMRQQKNNLGTLLSVNSPGRITPWFQLTSNSRTGILSLKYRLDGSNKPRQLDWELPKHHGKSPLAVLATVSVCKSVRSGNPETRQF